MAAEDPYARPGYRRYVLAVLTAGCALNFLDRQLLVILQEPIRRELGLSDTQLGLLSGFGFAGVYVVSGVLLALWSESRARRSVIAVAMGFWSLMTAACGLAQGYGQLLLARMGVAVGESVGGPASHSMIADIFPPRERAFAIAVYTTGINLGILAGYLLGGWINEYFGWRAAFLAIGLPGVLAALVLRATVQEPQRGRHDPPTLAGAPPPRLGSAIAALREARSFRWVALGASWQAFGLYGIGSWLPSYMMRNFGMGTGEVGTWLAATAGGVGALGTLAGGWLGDRLGRRDPRWYVWLPLAGGLLAAPFMLALLMAEDARTALLLNIAPVFVLFMYTAPVVAISHAMVGPQMRATTSAILFFVINLLGMGAGPLFAGFISDHFAGSFGDGSLRLAMLATLLLATAGGTVCYLRAAHLLPGDLKTFSS